MTVENRPAEKRQRIKNLIRMLREDTRNIDLWLELASLYDEAETKREILRGVLLIDPTNMVVQDGLYELDGTVETYIQGASVTEPPVDAESSDVLAEYPREEPAGQDYFETPKSVQRPALERKRQSRTVSKDRKRCPHCGGVIHVSATRCRHCQKKIEYGGEDESSQEQFGSWQDKKTKEDVSPRLRTGCLFALVILAIIVLLITILVVVPELPY
ncbi:MAG: zinc ribbon domain-containing protein [Anaerolineaceae bacterium]|nr:zinc ribbon domain-containing protein [Anaerolineaceae bacterium]